MEDYSAVLLDGRVASAPVTSDASDGDTGGGPGVRDLIGRDLTLAELQRKHILDVLRRVDGNRTRAAEVLGIPLRTLHRRLEEYGVLQEN